MKYDNQLRYAKQVIESYKGEIPLAVWLKEFFREHKQMGSSDRRTLSAIVYSWYRFGHHAFTSIDERMAAAISIAPGLTHLQEYFRYTFTADAQELNIFPAFDKFSEGLDQQAFAQSFLVQPDLFLRIRPNNNAEVLKKLSQANLAFNQCSESCVALPNSTKVEDVLQINREVVVQDKSSQQTGSLFTKASEKLGTSKLNAWDCCAASGGKSIMAYDLLKDIHLTVSDIRDSIIHNLDNRFREAGIKNYTSFVADVRQMEKRVHEFGPFDMIIADVPCSGSGTWARTPEQLYFFKREKIDYYSNLQKSIVTNAMKYLRKGGMLVYITCSVFQKENEKVVEHLEVQGMQKLHSELFTGYHEKADTLFGALLTNSAI